MVIYTRIVKSIVLRGLILLPLFISGSLVAQGFKGSIKGGINASRVGALGLNFNKTGISFGVGANYGFKEVWLLEVAIEYNQKGHKWIPDSVGVSHSTLQLEYADIIGMLYFQPKEVWRIGIGMSYGKLLSNVEEIDGIRYTYGPSEINYTDISLRFALQYLISSRWLIGLTYIHQVNYLLWGTASNSTVGFRLGYTFLKQ